MIRKTLIAAAFIAVAAACGQQDASAGDPYAQYQVGHTTFRWTDLGTVVTTHRTTVSRPRWLFHQQPTCVKPIPGVSARTTSIRSTISLAEAPTRLVRPGAAHSGLHHIGPAIRISLATTMCVVLGSPVSLGTRKRTESNDGSPDRKRIGAFFIFIAESLTAITAMTGSKDEGWAAKVIPSFGLFGLDMLATVGQDRLLS